MLQEAREEVVGSLSKLWKRNPYRSGGGLAPKEQTDHPRRTKESGTLPWVTTHQPFFYPAHPTVQTTLLSLCPCRQASPPTATPSQTYSATWPGAKEPMKAQRAPSKERTVQELDALPPRCHLWDRHL